MLQLDWRYRWLLAKYDHQERSPWFAAYDWGEDKKARATLRASSGLEDQMKNATTEWEQIQLLMAFVHGLSEHQGWNSADDLSALFLLEGARTGSVAFRCVEFAHMFQHVCAAFGIPARVVGLRRESSHVGIGKAHVVCDVWSSEWHKWIVFDPQLNTHYVDANGTPLSALEIHDRVISGRAAEIAMARAIEFQKERAWPFPAKENQKFEDLEVYEGFTREEIWESLQDRGDFQGFLEYWLSFFYYLSYRQHYEATRPKVDEADNADDAFFFYERGTLPKIVFQKTRQSPLYTQDRTRIDIPLNGVEVQWIVPTATQDTPIEETRCLQVRLQHSMPWFDHYLVSCNGQNFVTREPVFSWQLQPGSNELVVTPVNDQGRQGETARVEIEVLEV